MNNLAVSYSDAGRRDEALAMEEEVLALRRKVLGPEHPDTLTSMHNLAVYYGDAGRRDEALEMREEVLALRRKLLGPEHPETLTAMNNLASSYGDAGRRDEVLAMLEEVLALRRKVLGPEHPETLRVMFDLANRYADAGRADEALKLREEALALSRKVNGPEHLETMRAMGNLADSYFDAGRKDEAIRMQEEALEGFRKTNPENDIRLWNVRKLSGWLHEVGRKEEALKLREEWVALARKLNGPQHQETRQAMNKLAESYEESGRKDEAAKLRAELAELNEKPSPVAANEKDSGSKESVPALAERSTRNPSDKHLAIKVSALQAWFGMEAEQAETCRRMLAWAADKDANAAGGVPMLTCLRPIGDAGMRQAALEVARKVATPQAGKPPSPWYQMTLGMAQYRNGMFQEAADSLRSVLKLAAATPGMDKVDLIRGTTNLYLAMSLAQLGKADEARALLAATEAKMKPLPADETKPLAEKGTDHDDLIFWLAYKEAKAMLAE
jgi:tetratricopeptide (TPR) repeat protein